MAVVFPEMNFTTDDNILIPWPAELPYTTSRTCKDAYASFYKKLLKLQNKVQQIKPPKQLMDEIEGMDYLIALKGIAGVFWKLQIGKLFFFVCFFCCFIYLFFFCFVFFVLRLDVCVSFQLQYIDVIFA